MTHDAGITMILRYHGRALNTPMVESAAAMMVNCALAGMVPWRQVPTLQHELACLPTRWRRNIQAFVPRYARPVVLAVGRAKFHHDPPKNPLLRLWRKSIWRSI